MSPYSHSPAPALPLFRVSLPIQFSKLRLQPDPKIRALGTSGAFGSNHAWFLYSISTEGTKVYPYCPCPLTLSFLQSQVSIQFIEDSVLEAGK